MKERKKTKGREARLAQSTAARIVRVKKEVRKIALFGFRPRTLKKGPRPPKHDESQIVFSKTTDSVEEAFRNLIKHTTRLSSAKVKSFNTLCVSTPNQKCDNKLYCSLIPVIPDAAQGDLRPDNWTWGNDDLPLYTFLWEMGFRNWNEYLEFRIQSGQKEVTDDLPNSDKTQTQQDEGRIKSKEPAVQFSVTTH